MATTLYFYLKGGTNEFIGQGFSTFDFQDNEIIPPEATTIAPPAFTPQVSIPVFDDILETWSLVDDFRGVQYLNTLDYTIGTIVDIDTPFPPNTTTSFDPVDYEEIVGTSKRNLLLDADFKFWTEGLTVQPTTYRYVSGGTACERNLGATGTTCSRQGGFDNSRYCLRIQRDNADANTNAIRIGQILSVDEAIHFGGRKVTFSFSTRAGSNFSANNYELKSIIYAGTATDEEGGATSGLTDFTVGSNFDSKTHTLLTSGADFRFRHTYELPAGTRQIKVVLEFVPTGVALANDYFEVTNLKLEDSEVATPFVFDSVPIAQDKLDEYYLTTYENGTPAGTQTSVGQHSFHVQGNTTSDIFALENVRYNFPRVPSANIYAPSALNAVNQITLNDGGVITEVGGSINDVSSKNSVCSYDDPPTAPDEGVLSYHYVLDARL